MCMPVDKASVYSMYLGYITLVCLVVCLTMLMKMLSLVLIIYDSVILQQDSPCKIERKVCIMKYYKGKLIFLGERLKLCMDYEVLISYFP